MKWENNGITYKRGNYEVLVARYDDSDFWFMPRALMTQQRAKHRFLELGKAIGAKRVEVREVGDAKVITNDIVVFDEWRGTFKFWNFETFDKYDFELKVKQ